MFISKIELDNFRNFEEETVLFNPGLNVIIGHNNSGKTNLLRALQLVFDRNSNVKPTIDDFCKKIKDFSKPPSIQISVFIRQEEKEPDDDFNVVYDWLIESKPNYLAQLTYSFELPLKHLDEYKSSVEEFKDQEGNFDIDACLRTVQKKFLSKYVSRIYGGQPSKKENASRENLDRFDFQFLTAIRDAEREMFFGNNTILKDVLNYFIDYDIYQGRGVDELSQDELTDLKQREEDFSNNSKNVLESLIGRIDKDQILKYSEDTGADKGGIPNFDANVSEQDLLFALRLIVEKAGMKIPINNNGLGYNNLLYIALILAKMQMEVSKSFMGDNAKVFPMMAIEEPEAHLHPALQSKFLKFFEENLKTNKQARQVFVTSHSTHITSAVELDSIICLYTDTDSTFRIGYPGKVYSNSKVDKSSKIYAQRFLDATKSNMLFAERIIFVEGLSEQLLISCFAKYLNLEDNLINDHAAVISVDSRTFKHFLKIFSFNEDESPYAIKKKIVCITDADPSVKKNNKWESVFPFLLEHYEENKALSTHVQELKSNYDQVYDNIFIYHPEEGKGKTLEYELALINPDSELLITHSFPSQNSAHTPKNFSELQGMIAGETEAMVTRYQEMRGIENIEVDEILAGISASSWEDLEKNKALIAAIYYTIVKNAKGEHAFFLEKQLRENLEKEEGILEFNIPEYIQNALQKITA